VGPLVQHSAAVARSSRATGRREADLLERPREVTVPAKTRRRPMYPPTTARERFFEHFWGQIALVMSASTRNPAICRDFLESPRARRHKTLGKCPGLGSAIGERADSFEQLRAPRCAMVCAMVW